MRTSSRRAAAAITVAALLTAGAAAPPVTAGPGPVVIDDHDSHIAPRAYDISSSTGGTVYATDDGGFGRIHLAGPGMTTSTPMLDLGARPRTRRTTTISGSRVAIPVAGATETTPVVAVRHCLVGACNAPFTLTVTASWQYLGNADDRAVIYNPATSTIGLQAWTGGTPTNTYPILEPFAEPPAVVADAAGIVLSGGGNVVYIHRATGHIATLGYGNDGVVLTPTHIVWYALGAGDPEAGPLTNDIYRVPRSTTETSPEPSIVVELPETASIETIAANDTGVAWLAPNGDADGTKTMYSMTYAGTPVAYARPISTSGLSAFEGTAQILVNDRLGGVPGLYRVTPGSYGGTLTGIVPARGANTLGLAVSNGRVFYVDDMTDGLPMWTRNVTGGAPGPESLFTSSSGGSLSVSGPYYAYITEGPSPDTTVVVYGHTGGGIAARTFPSSEVGKVAVSGRRVLITGARTRVLDVATGALADLGTTYGAIFGEFVATINYHTGAVHRRNLETGLVQGIRGAVAGCSSFCVDDDAWQLALWGHEVVYAFRHGGTATAAVSGLWNGTTGSTVDVSDVLTPLGEADFTEIAYWSGLLLVAHRGAVVKLYDMRAAGAPGEGVTVDSFAEEPFAMDGSTVAWRPLTNLKAVVRDVRDFAPGHVPAIRYLGGSVPSAFRPEVSAWKPQFLVSQEMTGSLLIHRDSPTGEVVKTIQIGTLHGEMLADWDGTDDADADLDQGTYYWTLETGTVTPETVKSAGGTHAATGSVYLSRDPLPAPSLNAPALSTNVSATGSFPLSWTVPAGAPAGTRYVLQRSVNGGGFSTIATTPATSLSHAGSPGTTYRFRVAALDPAGRLGAFSAVRQTIVPFNDNAFGTGYSGSWTSASSRSLFGGQHRYSGTAGSIFSFRSTGTAIHLVGNRGASYGQFQVSIDGGAWSGLIDAYSPTTQIRRVLFSRGGLSNAAHTIRVRVHGTRSRPHVGIDAVGFQR